MADESPRILLVDGRDAAGATTAILEDAGYRVTRATTAAQALQRVTDTPPGLVLLAPEFGPPGGGSLLTDLRTDGLVAHVPVVLLLEAPATPESIEWNRVPCDDFLVEPWAPAELCARTALALARGQRDVNANPLTGLPGNMCIMREIERRLARNDAFAVAYLDIDHFKSYNDKYGFARGDEILRMTARIVVNAVRSVAPVQGYVGHVGGDDFLFLTDSPRIEAACKEILNHFDLVVPNFYDDEDRARGTIESTDRQGKPQTFPLMTCSIAVIDVGSSAIRHPGDISARAAEVKHFAKELPGSNYLVDRRKA